MNIKNKNVLLTGASRGIGSYIAKTLAKNGAFVIGVARSQENLNLVKKDIENEGGEFYSFPFDLNSIQALSKLVDNAKAIRGNIDILVNNAGIELYKPFQNYTANEVSDILNINLYAPMELTRLLLPSMLERGGHIVSIASLAGKKGLPFSTPYSASKAGLIMWTDGMRQELVDTNVEISVICPGYISDTGMFFDGGVDPPPLLGSSKPQAVADAVLKAIRKNKAEIIVNHGPIKPLLAIGQISPKLGDAVIRIFGVPELSKKRIKK
ncbi:MAG: SDR family NAD(P)-dependent oxidoreductase [Fidelibacterota bacterium]